ncbi:class I SAM-dependent methyltransferase [Candidatus Dojkabacteria bacterium]|nr:class I SAM-dependent methyltransferase [Candidatus Dojkabacteria bacterium]
MQKRFSGTNSSWNRVHKWYSKKVGDGGHYFHEHVILPNVKRILNTDNQSKILDIACGDGVLSRYMDQYSGYLGFDIAEGLISEAKRKNSKENTEFVVQNAGTLFTPDSSDYTHATVILALQNIESYRNVFINAFNHLGESGMLVLVINHPYFRIPKSTSWEVDPSTRFQYRRVSRYLSPHKIRIDMNPGSTFSKEFTYSYHVPLSNYIEALNEVGFVTLNIEEWVSDKVSVGAAAVQENFARNEFPLFMCIVCRKLPMKSS